MESARAAPNLAVWKRMGAFFMETDSYNSRIIQGFRVFSAHIIASSLIFQHVLIQMVQNCDHIELTE